MNDSANNVSNDLPPNDVVASRTRAIFRDACRGTDSYHALRLGLARRKALGVSSLPRMRRLLAPLAGGVVACCALAVGVTMLHPPKPPAHATPSVKMATAVASATTIDADGVDVGAEVNGNQIDMVEQLDFYRWLATQPTVAAAPARGH